MYFLKLKHCIAHPIQKLPQMTFHFSKQFLCAFTSHRCASPELSKASGSLISAINCKVFREYLGLSPRALVPPAEPP